MKKINIIASMSNNRCIGNNNKLLWKQSDDLKRFKKLTDNNIVIMGKNTFESLSFKPLKNRKNIIITRNNNLSYDNCIMARTIEESIEISENIEGEIFVIGGSSIYEQFLFLSNKLYVTIIDINIDGDTYFPYIDLDIWTKIYNEYHKKDIKNEYNYSYEIYSKKDI